MSEHLWLLVACALLSFAITVTVYVYLRLTELR